MSTKTKFGGKSYTLPGAYSRIISGQNNPPRTLDFGKLLIIDTKPKTTHIPAMGGSGINGTLKQGKDSISRFSSISEFRDFCPYGSWWKAAEFLFNPDGRGNGISELIYVKAATTTPAQMTFSAVSGGSFVVKTRDESTAANGVIDETRATCIYTGTVAGTAGDKHVIKVNGVTVAEYTVISSDTLAEVMTGLSFSFAALGICEYVTKNTTTITFTAPVGLGATTITPTLASTGTAAGTIVPFANGVDATNLYSGYGYTVETGVLNASKWIMKIWRGTYRGLAPDSIPFDEITDINSIPELIATSPEFDNIQTLIDWGTTGTDFGAYFALGTCTAGAVVSGDITAIASYIPAVNGLDRYSIATDFDDVLTAIKDLKYNFVITAYSGKYIASETNVLKLQSHLQSDVNNRLMLIGGRDTAIDNTITQSEAFDSEKIGIIHGGIRKRSQAVSFGYRTWNTFYHTAFYAGRILGLDPQTPVTYKSLNIDGLQDNLSVDDQNKADAAGVLCTIYDEDRGLYINMHDVNTLQEADYVLNNDGRSHLIQVERIKAQINDTLILNAKLDLLANPEGVNRNSLSKTDAIEWTKTQLGAMIGTLIMEFRNVTATIVGDVIFVEYEAMPNSEIKSIFFTGKLYL